MALERDKILLDNLREALKVYQLAVWWSISVSAAFFLVSLRLGDPDRPPLKFPFGDLSVSVAWFVALALFFVFGGYALNAINRATALLGILKPPEDVREAIALIPSLATNPNGFYRVGTVLICPAIFLLAFGIEL